MILKIFKYKSKDHGLWCDYVFSLNEEVYGLKDLGQRDFYLLKNYKGLKQILLEDFEVIFSLNVPFKVLTKSNLKLVQSSLKKNYPEYFL